jgi:hypothetical protein
VSYSYSSTRASSCLLQCLPIPLSKRRQEELGGVMEEGGKEESRGNMRSQKRSIFLHDSSCLLLPPLSRNQEESWRKIILFLTPPDSSKEESGGVMKDLSRYQEESWRKRSEEYRRSQEETRAIFPQLVLGVTVTARLRTLLGPRAPVWLEYLHFFQVLSFFLFGLAPSGAAACLTSVH